jgi:hypothetical protein
MIMTRIEDAEAKRFAEGLTTLRKIISGAEAIADLNDPVARRLLLDTLQDELTDMRTNEG